MLRYAALQQLILTRVREFFREPEAIFWVYGFPVILAIGLGLAFRSAPEREVRAAVVEGPRAASTAETLRAAGVEIELASLAEARRRLASGKVDLLIVPPGSDGEDTVRYLLDPARADSLLARERVDAALQRAAGRTDPLEVVQEEITEPGARYIDFLLPGIIGMNLMGGGMYGVGFVIVDMRVRKLLKRFRATPMRGRDFFLAVLTSRVIFMVPELVFLFLVATLGFGMPFRGDVVALLAVIMVASLAFTGLGLLVGTRASKLETISGLMNLVMLPMWILGGIFFNAERFPDVMQPFIQALPLTAANDALRAVILDGASLWSQAHELGILAAWALVCFGLSVKLFRWL